MREDTAFADELAAKGFKGYNSTTEEVKHPVICQVTVTDPTATPIYRFYNPDSQEYLYTSDVHEKDVLIRLGWGRYEGVAWQAPVTRNATPVYRLYHPILKDHHYTLDPHEVQVLKQRGGDMKVPLGRLNKSICASC